MGVGVIHVFSQRKNVNASLNVFTDRRKWNKYMCGNIRTIQLELVYLNNLRLEYELSNIAEGRKA